MDRASELTLVAALRSGDPLAFDQLHHTFHRRLFGFLVRLSRSRDVAEDLVEDTWLRVVRHARLLDPETRLAPWLFTIAHNLYRTYCRNRALDDAVTAQVGLWPTSPACSPFELTAASELERRVEAALAILPLAHREVLLLVGVEGFTPSEAAAVCGVTPEAMRQRLSRARAALSEELQAGEARATLRWREVKP